MANSKIIGAVTNEFGYYTITIPCGNIDLTYSYVGCADVKQSIDLQRDTVINISLLQAASLKASTIVGRKDAGIQSTYMGAMEIPQEMIKNMPVVLGEPDVIKTIQLMPGVQGGMEGFSGIYVRGGGADENLMMLDGTPLYNVSHLLGLLSVFTPEAVKKVTFYKGSFPARYGGRVSSIVDVGPMTEMPKDSTARYQQDSFRKNSTSKALSQVKTPHGPSAHAECIPFCSTG